ncbi:hypothetical protein [Scytonema sp. UIC 10036]|uniref:hypothetical protein n=1 Tax=Scytonema sp. UIC 10036 TaxID=2304196 RepID=UPI00140FCC99|nr:hypothetical protein [Scytonema sp. UIC 10036]
MITRDLEGELCRVLVHEPPDLVENTATLTVVIVFFRVNSCTNIAVASPASCT